MHRLLILLSLLPLLAALILRKLNADRVLTVSRKTRLNSKGETLARKMLDSMGHQQVEIKTTKRAWAGAAVTGEHWLSLPANPAAGSSAADHGLVALRVGLYLTSLRDPKALGRRRWALRFGHVFPIFTVIVCVFGLAVAKLPPLWALGVVMGSLGLAACAQALTLTTELQAATLATVVLEKKRTLPRLSDEEAVVAATRAWAWHGIVPGLLSRLM
ncbi:MAG: zinc metallopeptidase [Akkermansiaceae bacterium]|nr:zinc metallopeptidase [Akkermansiaceae bacterium]